MSIKTTSTKLVYQNRWLSVREDQIERADGSPGIYGVVDKPDFALIIPIDGDDLYLVEQYRYPVSARYAEFPQGSWEDDPSADPLELARGELQEETGLQAGKMEYLGRLFIAYGMSSQGFHVFRATELTAAPGSLDHEEQDLVTRKTTVAEFERAVRSTEIKDAATLAAWTLHKLNA
jgi:8-oxo-dGTP pyrophosphatase MutT (NUDIX family)